MAGRGGRPSSASGSADGKSKEDGADTARTTESERRRRRRRNKISVPALRDFISGLPRVDEWHIKNIPKEGIVDSLGSTFEFAAVKQMLSRKVTMSFAGETHGVMAEGVMEDVFVRYFTTVLTDHWDRPGGAWLYLPIKDPPPASETYVPSDLTPVEPKDDSPFAKAQADSINKKRVLDERQRKDAYFAKAKADEVLRIKRMEHMGRVLLRCVIGNDSGTLRRTIANCPISPVVLRYLLGNPREAEQVELHDMEVFNPAVASDLRQLLVGCGLPFQPVPRFLRLRQSCLPGDLAERLDIALKGAQLPPLDLSSDEEDGADDGKAADGSGAGAGAGTGTGTDDEVLDADGNVVRTKKKRHKTREEREEVARLRALKPFEMFGREAEAHRRICSQMFVRGPATVQEYVHNFLHDELIETRRKGLAAMRRGFQSVELLSTTLKELDAESLAETMHGRAHVPLMRSEVLDHVQMAYERYGDGPASANAASAFVPDEPKKKIWV